MDRPAHATAERLLARFGISVDSECVWRLLICEPSIALPDLAAKSRLAAEHVDAAFNELLDARLVRRHPSPCGFAAIDPALSVESKIVCAERQLSDSHRELADLRTLIPTLSMEFERGQARSGPRYGFDLVVGLAEIRRQVYLAGERTANEHRSLHRAVSSNGLRHGRETDLASLNRGVRQRSIVGLGDLTEPSIYAYFAEVHSQGEEVRTLHEVPTRLLIFDSDIAVLPVGPTETPQQAMFVRDRTLIDVLIYLFDRMWADASPVFADIDASETRTDRHVRVLELLAGGAKDEAIARTLGIGVRTIRRDIAELKAVLGVTSRAEVVAAAVRRGWL